MEAILFSPDPCAYLPHRAPFLFIDRVLSRESGVCASAEFVVPVGCGYFPPLLLVESMAQLGGIAAGQRQGEGGVLAALRQVELPGSVDPGVLYSVYSRVVKRFGQLVLIEGEVREADQTIARATLTIGLGGEGSPGALP
jgi:3-hydroxyacyl-[acyl-carrier-protein] dehydratase